MKALILGAEGQLGTELRRTPPPGWDVGLADLPDLDITRIEDVRRILDTDSPDLVINAAAYTAVDKAEEEPELSHRVNAEAPGQLARQCRAQGRRLIHISTDFVFDGRQSRPYQPDDAAHPLSVYGKSKLEGERLVLAAAEGEVVILRTSWLYSAHGANFVKTMLRLMAERDSLAVVCDQIGSPTWARGLARAVWSFAQSPELCGVFHWSDAGVASWYDFAVAIQEEAVAVGLLPRRVPIEPIPTARYPTPAERPSYSVLDQTAAWSALGYRPEHWRTSLRRMLREMAPGCAKESVSRKGG